jgi:malonyl-CoA O-methyltransferase
MTLLVTVPSPTTAAETPVPDMDAVAVRRWSVRPVSESAWLHEEVGGRMAQRLAWINATPAQWLGWEPVHGGLQAHRKVAERYPQSRQVIHAKRPQPALAALKVLTPHASGWLGRWRYTPPGVADADTQADMLWANMQLHHTHLPKTLLTHWHRALRENGFLMFSCLGPDSLKELRGVYSHMGWASPAQPFTDMHDWGDMLVQAGFAEPVMDMERITLTYANAPALLAELRTLGRNLSLQRSPLTRGKNWLAQLHAGLEAHMPRTDDGRMLLTFEVVYGHAHKGAPRIPVASSSAVSLHDMKRMLGRDPSRVP